MIINFFLPLERIYILQIDNIRLVWLNFAPKLKIFYKFSYTIVYTIMTDKTNQVKFSPSLLHSQFPHLKKS